MNDEQLKRNLQSIGLACFVEYYEKFACESLSNTEIAEILKSKTDYTEKSCNSRTSHARAIIRSGLGLKALAIVENSDSPLVSQVSREKARELIRVYSGS